MNSQLMIIILCGLFGGCMTGCSFDMTLQDQPHVITTRTVTTSSLPVATTTTTFNREIIPTDIKDISNTLEVPSPLVHHAIEQPDTSKLIMLLK
jgi:hypothetical protein